MIQSAKIPFLWDHTFIGDIITVAFDNHRQFIISVSTQVLKLASKFACQLPEDEMSCLLIGSCDNSEGNKVNIKIDRIECNLANYLSDNKLLCVNDVCVPLKIFKQKSNVVIHKEDFISSFEEYFKSFEDHSTSLILSKVIFLKACASFSSDESKAKTQLTNLSWINFKLLIPDLHLTLSPINKLPIFRSALISSFEGHVFSSQFDSAFTYGYLSIDLSGKVYFLLPSDERTMTAAIVGVWVHGVSDVSDMLAIAACMKYILIKDQSTKVAKPPLPFLLAQFTGHSKDSIRFYDVKWPNGPTEDRDSSINRMNFLLLSAEDSLSRYYQAPNDKAHQFTATLTAVASSSRDYESISGALKTFLAKNCVSERDDTVPRLRGNSRDIGNIMMSNHYSGLEVSDVSLLVNEVSTLSSENSITQINQAPCKTNLLMSAYHSEITGPLKAELHASTNANDEANPRPLLRKQHPPLASASSSVTSRAPVRDMPTEHRYQTVQYISQPMFPYPAIYPANPYMLLPQNIYLPGHEHNVPVVAKPPVKPKQIESTNKNQKVTSNKAGLGKRVTATNLKVTVPKSNSRVDRAVITDVTNTSSKRILQLDKEEDLAMLEVLVQQIINQRRQDKPVMVSTGVNTSQTFAERVSPNIVEVSTDLPSFIGATLCTRCQQLLDHDRDNIPIDMVQHSMSAVRDDKENYFNSGDLLSYNRPTESSNANDVSDHNDQEQWFDQSDESVHYNELLDNLEDFVKQSRNSAADDKNGDDAIGLTTQNENSMTQLNILEEAVQNLRELDMDRDFEGQYWETMKHSETTEASHMTNDVSNCVDRDSFEATILQQKINYVSIFLNNSTVSVDSTDGRHSLSEQSLYIDSLARKYLHRASTELERLSVQGSVTDGWCSGERGDCGGGGGCGDVGADVSVATRRYMERNHLMDRDQGEPSSMDTYYSSIRMPDGDPRPRHKVAISSTPARHCAQISAGCRRAKAVPLTRDSWSGVRILDGLDQQPAVLPATVQDCSWDCGQSALSCDMVLDLARLRRLPKYL